MKTCLNCNQPLNLKSRGRPKKYCSKDCREKLRHKLNYKQKNHVYEERKTTKIVCAFCAIDFEARNSRAKYCSDYCRKKGYWENRKEHKLVCLNCSISFESKNKNVKFCSNACVGEHQRIQAIERAKQEIPRHIFPSRRARREYLRRKRIRDNFVEHVDINTLIQRDKGICQLCKEPIRENVSYLHDLAPTIDHVIAISNGGEHSYANCQLAHRICNNVKNNHKKIEGDTYVKTKQKREGTSPEVTNKR